MSPKSTMNLFAVAVLAFANLSHALPQPNVVVDGLAARETPATPNAGNNPGLAGNGAGEQFITGLCTSDADCASGCCGFNSALCAGAIVAQERDGGCGFGNAQPNDNAAQALTGGTFVAPTPVASTNSAASSVAAAPLPSLNAAGQFDNPGAAGNGNGAQFITGLCLSDADCASGCCGFNTGLCAGAVIAQTRDGGCGFGDAQPNNNAAVALGF